MKVSYKEISGLVRHRFILTLAIIMLSANSFADNDDDVYDMTVKAVGFISDRSGAVASGFFINENTFITNHHVTGELDVESASIEMKDGKTFRVRKIIKEYRDVDLAILLIDSYSTHMLWLEDNNSPEKSDEVYSIGNPTDNKQRVDYFKMTKGRIRRITEDDWHYDKNSEDKHKALVIQHTAIIKPGNSGGPLLNKNGKVIGVNTFFYDDSLNYAVHVDELIKILKKNGIEYNEKVHKSDTREKSNKRSLKQRAEYVLSRHEYYLNRYYMILISAVLLYYMTVMLGVITVLTYIVVKGNRKYLLKRN